MLKTEMSESKKYFCRNCGVEISREEYEVNDGLCDVCQWEEEDDDLIIGDDLF
jgi:NMD protein affecting ribosome stability and mRNA decay